jgi:phage-related protein
MPEEVRVTFGRRLNLAQRGRLPPSTKPWQGLAGVFEMVEEFASDAYRAVYLARFKESVYVLHAFQKRSRSGRKTDKTDIEAIEIALPVGCRALRKGTQKERHTRR